MKQIFRIFSFINDHPLASKNKWAAYKRFLNWQMKQLVSPGDRVCTLVEDSVLLISKGMAGATGNIYCGLLEFEDMAFVLHLLRPGDMMGDIGANVGVYTILAAKNTGARVIALEPGLDAFQRLELNVNLNQVKEQALILNWGASSAEGELLFTQKMDAVNHVALGDEAKTQQDIIKIKVKTLDEVFIKEEPLLLKIDVEGYEHEVIIGAKRLLASNSLLAIIIELNGSGIRYGVEDSIIHEEILSYGFLPYRYDPFSRELHLLHTPGHLNTLYLRNVDSLAQRLMSSRKFNVIGHAI